MTVCRDCGRDLENFMFYRTRKANKSGVGIYVLQPCVDCRSVGAHGRYCTKKRKAFRRIMRKAKAGR